MNRLQLRQTVQDDKSVRQPNSATNPSPISTRSHLARTSLFSPIHYEANYAYPLLVWLHDVASTERQLRTVMPRISLRNYVAVAVRGQDGLTGSAGPTLTSAATNFSWFQSADGIELASDLVSQSIELAQEKFHIDPRRVFLAGAGVGGTMALRLALRTPRRFAGVISLGGPLPERHLPLAAINTARQQLRVLLTQSRTDNDYHTPQLCGDLRLLHSAGIDVTVRQYPQQDYLGQAQLSDVDTWIMDQLSGKPVVDAAPVSRYDNTSRN
ncbi:MAG: alpha/beta hydrolase-fold protein [Planctomycetota bacterium]|nr:alpha/beta hydrolase-fold protein [Planctomycetota bacterium]